MLLLYTKCNLFTHEKTMMAKKTALYLLRVFFSGRYEREAAFAAGFSYALFVIGMGLGINAAFE